MSIRERREQCFVGCTLLFVLAAIALTAWALFYP